MGWDFSRASERNPLEMKVPIRWRGFQPISWISARDENPSPLSEIVLGFSAWANRLKNLQEGQFCNWNGISAWAEKAVCSVSCFRRKQNGLHFSPGWNSRHIIVCSLCIVFQAKALSHCFHVHIISFAVLLSPTSVGGNCKFYFQFGLLIAIIKVLLHVIGVYYHGW